MKAKYTYFIITKLFVSSYIQCGVISANLSKLHFKIIVILVFFVNITNVLLDLNLQISSKRTKIWKT